MTEDELVAQHHPLDGHEFEQAPGIGDGWKGLVCCSQRGSKESTLRMRWPKYWSFSFSIIPSKEHPGLISSRMDWLDLLAVQGTLKSFLQHHSSKASILRRSAFFIVQLSHPYMTTGKTIALTRWTFVGIFLYFNRKYILIYYLHICIFP